MQIAYMLEKVLIYFVGFVSYILQFWVEILCINLNAFLYFFLLDLINVLFLFLLNGEWMNKDDL